MKISSVRNVKDARQFAEDLKNSISKPKFVVNFRLVSESLKVLARKESGDDFRELVKVYCEFYKERGFEDPDYLLSHLEWLCRFADHGARIGEFNGKMNLELSIYSTQQYFCQIYGACLSCEQKNQQVYITEK